MAFFLFRIVKHHYLRFIIASFFIGYVVDKHVKSRNFFPMLVLMTFANFIIIYGFGLANLSIWLNVVKGSSVSFWKILMMGAIPFIPGGIFKIILAAGLTKVITPKKDFSK